MGLEVVILVFDCCVCVGRRVGLFRVGGCGVGV